eukprot:CAMPEP_0195288858 /NCGR_PEP_ID=MMETSP0707-20130614/5353_1 /TAXON_ID=33640 /ORGANISM="Asterionellopsis glacialis, Strain CCMP134" /LENGTH=241 /DNA_ID=CAMNT_0040348773 /DNA_START=30 /DNA_END=755 /DNA_ORIENTATION=+
MASLLVPALSYDLFKHIHSSNSNRKLEKTGGIRGQRTNHRDVVTRALRKKKRVKNVENPYTTSKSKSNKSNKSYNNNVSGTTHSKKKDKVGKRNVPENANLMSAAQVAAADVEPCSEALRLMWYYDDVEKRENSIEHESGLTLEIPVYDAIDLQVAGLWQCMFTYMPRNNTMYQCAYSFDYDETDKTYSSQIFTAGSEGYHNIITGGSGRFACAKGVEEVLEDRGHSTIISLKICSSCAAY